MTAKLKIHQKVAESKGGHEVRTRCGLNVEADRARVRGKAIDCQRCLR